jgi:hypothetical protein
VSYASQPLLPPPLSISVGWVDERKPNISPKIPNI